MKKIYGLMLVPVLALSGCVSKITNEEGVKRAEEIAEHKLDVSEVKALKLESKSLIEADVTEDGVRNYMKIEVENVTEFSKDKSFAHSYTKYAATYIEGKNKNSSSSEAEYWAYVKDEKFVAATRSVDNAGKETKVYSEVGSAAAATFKASLASLVEGLVPELKAETLLKTAVAILSSTEKEQKEAGMVYKVQAYSGGEGSLVVKGSVDVTAYEGYKGTGSGKVKYAWDNYMLKEVSVEMKATADDSAKKAKGSVSVSTKESVKLRCRPSYPNLKEFKKA